VFRYSRKSFKRDREALLELVARPGFIRFILPEICGQPRFMINIRKPEHFARFHPDFLENGLKAIAPTDPVPVKF
jgi:hypothetical protein